MSWETFKKWLGEESIKTGGKKASKVYNDQKSIFKVDMAPTNEQYKANVELASELAEMEKNYWATKAVERPDYTAVMPTSNGMIKKSYDEKPEEDMLLEAKVLTEEQKEADLSKLETDKENTIADLQASLTQTEAEMSEEELALQEDIRKKELNIKNETINSGLSHSSIKQNRYDALHEYAGQEMQKIVREYDPTLTNVLSEIAKIESAYNYALETYDLTYATNLKTSLASVKEAESKRLQEIQDYNNYVDKQQSAYTKEREALIAELEAKRMSDNELMQSKSEANLALGNSVAPKDIAYRNTLYEKVKDFYTTDMELSQAKILIDQNSYALKMYLGQDLYNKLWEDILENEA